MGTDLFTSGMVDYMILGQIVIYIFIAIISIWYYWRHK